MRPPHPISTGAAIVAAALAFLGGGCSHADPAPDPAAGAPLLGAEGGVELRSLLVHSHAAVGRALAPYAARPVDVDPRLRAELEACGIRFAAINLASGELERIEAAIAEADQPASVTRQWITPGPAWVEAVKSAPNGDSRIIALHDSRFRAPPGVIRLLARCWSEPVARGWGGGEGAGGGGGGEGAPPGAIASAPAAPRVGAVMHIELVPQSVPRVQADPWLRSLENATAPRGLEEQGQVFRRLLAAVRLNPGQALAVVFETPGVVWPAPSTSPPPANSPAPTLNPDGAGPLPPGSASDIGPPSAAKALAPGEVRLDPEAAPGAQPPAPAIGEERSVQQGFLPGADMKLYRTPTLGEALFASGPPDVRAGVTGAAPRTILFIVPRVRDEFRLLGP